MKEQRAASVRAVEKDLNGTDATPRQKGTRTRITRAVVIPVEDSQPDAEPTSYSTSLPSKTGRRSKGTTKGVKKSTSRSDRSESGRAMPASAPGPARSFAERIAAAAASMRPVADASELSNAPAATIEAQSGAAGLPLTKNQRREMRRREMEALRNGGTAANRKSGT